jgi:hypothetical protein
MTNRDCIQASARNRDIAEQQVQRIRQQMDRAAPGEVTDLMRCDLSRYKAEFEHWSSYTLYYKARALREGADAVVHMSDWGGPSPRQAQATQPQRAPARDPRLPREPGEDREEDIPF